LQTAANAEHFCVTAFIKLSSQYFS